MLDSREEKPEGWRHLSTAPGAGAGAGSVSVM